MSQVAKIPLRQVDSIQKLLLNDMARDQLGAVAAKHLSPERLMRVTANAIRTTPKLQNCEPMSFLGALMQCAALGLEPNTVMGHAYLIPFDNSRKIDGKWVKIPEVQLIVGYKGLIDLARRSGHITSISANVHYDDDELWEYEEGTESKLRHVPGPQDGKPLHAYAIAKFVEGGHAYVVLPWSRVMKIRDGSQGWQSAVKFGKTANSPWASHEEAMAKKTAIRALAKYLPLSVEFRDAVAVDNDSGNHVDYAQFALKPEGGVTIEGDYVDGESAEEGEDGEEEKDGADEGEPEEDDKPKKKADTKEPAQKAQKAQKDDKAEKKEPESKKQDAKEPSAHQPTYDEIVETLVDGGGVAATRRWYEKEIAAMKAEDPDMHKALEAELEAYEKAEGGEE